MKFDGTDADSTKKRNGQTPKTGEIDKWFFFEPLRRDFFLFVVPYLRNCAQSLGTWCSGITSASHAEGLGFKSQCVHIRSCISFAKVGNVGQERVEFPTLGL